MYDDIVLNHEKYNIYGSKMKIININKNKLTVKFDNGIVKDTNRKSFINGTCHNVYDETVYKIGYEGKGKYKITKNRKHTIQHEYWSKMLQRCYDEKYQKTHSTYIGCLVCDEWLNFQNFAQWFDENYYIVEDETMCLDKDILVKGNKIYSPNTCIFAPQRINKLFTKRNKMRGYLPIGVSFLKKSNKFQSKCKTYNNQKYLGCYNSPIDAFNAYKVFKEQYIKQVADYYKNQIPNKLYNAMCNYKVEITD